MGTIQCQANQSNYNFCYKKSFPLAKLWAMKNYNTSTEFFTTHIRKQIRWAGDEIKCCKTSSKWQKEKVLRCCIVKMYFTYLCNKIRPACIHLGYLCYVWLEVTVGASCLQGRTLPNRAWQLLQSTIRVYAAHLAASLSPTCCGPQLSTKFLNTLAPCTTTYLLLPFSTKFNSTLLWLCLSLTCSFKRKRCVNWTSNTYISFLKVHKRNRPVILYIGTRIILNMYLVRIIILVSNTAVESYRRSCYASSW